MSLLSNYSSDTSLLMWLALFPLTYIAHVAEEYFCGGGYSEYLFRNYAVELSPPRFLALQSLGLVLMTLSVVLAVSFQFPYTMLAMLGSTVLVNGAVHALKCLVGGRYEPGLVTGIALWIPLGVVTLLNVCRSMPTARFLFAASIGIVINVVVEVIAIRAGRLP